MIYLDYAATTPMSEVALCAYNEGSQLYFGNASSLHDIGMNARDALQLCRKQHSLFLNGETEGIYFTSGGTEANILAILSIVQAYKSKGNHLITTKVEHASLFHLFQQLENDGFEVTYLDVNEHGTIQLDILKQAIRPTTILASIHHGNGEIGTVQPLEEIGEILKAHQIIFHSDCVQTYGEIKIDVKKCKVDSISVSSHKIYGPKGVGFCYISPSVLWKSIYDGTTHEDGFRPGTVDVPSIVSFTAAAQHMMETMEERAANYNQLRTLFLQDIKKLSDKIMVEQSLEAQLPQIIGLTCLHVQGQYMMLECNRHGICISTGSACQVGMESPSRTMLAIGKSESEAKCFIRISLGSKTTKEELERTVIVMQRIFQSLPSL